MNLRFCFRKTRLLFITGFVLLGSFVQAHVDETNVCTRSSAVRAELQERFRKNCNEITSTDLTSLTYLHLLPIPPITDPFQVGDFDGLSSINTLQISYNGHEPLPGNLFQGMRSLKQIHLSVKNLETLSAKLFRGLDDLTRVEISDSGLTALPEDLLWGLKKLTHLIFVQQSFFNRAPISFVARSFFTIGI